MKQIITSNLRIHTGGFKECVIATHGGWTPKRKVLKVIELNGSGMTNVPDNLPVMHCYAFHGQPSVGTFSRLAYDNLEKIRKQYFPNDDKIPSEYAKNYTQFTPPIVQSYEAGDEIENYSLTFNDKCEEWDEKYATRDLIRIVRPGVKAHLSDVFAALRTLRLQYDVLHYGACRVDKTQTGDSIQHAA